MCQVSLKDMVDDSSIQFVDAEVSCVGTGRRQGVKGLAVTCEGTAPVTIELPWPGSNWQAGGGLQP